MKAVTWIGLLFCAGGFAMMVAPFVVPREAFGELGHGDGLGLAGLSVWGLIIGAVGLVVAIVAGISSENAAKENIDALEGEEKK